MIKFVFCILLTPLLTEAYIPKASMVMSRIDKNIKTSQWYKVTQKVSFLQTSQMPHSAVFYETWWRGPSTSFVEITSLDFPKIKISYLYQGRKKIWINHQNEKISKIKDYIELYFSQKKFLPPWILTVPQLKLARAMGGPNYFFEKGDKKLWVEQDEFVIRQVEWGPHLLQVHEYQPLLRYLFFPKKRTFTSPQYKVVIEFLKSQTLKNPPKNRLKINKWNEIKIDTDIELIKSFYQNLR